MRNSTSSLSLRPIPPLEPGDHLTRAEFERRFDATPGLKRAELLEGIVFIPPRVRTCKHGHAHSTLTGCLCHYAGFTAGVLGAHSASVRLDDNNMPQPDSLLFILHGGQAHIDEDDYLAGPPELAGEIASSSVSIDLHKKKSIYRKFGVQEYVVWRVDDREVDWFKLTNNDFVPLPRHPSGQLRSEVFPGLWLDVDALVAQNWHQLKTVLQQGLASPEHTAFVARLATQAPPPATAP